MEKLKIQCLSFILFEPFLNMGKTGYDKLNISFKDMDTAGDISGIKAIIKDKTGNIVGNFNENNKVLTIDNFKYNYEYTVIEEKIYNENYEKSPSYSFCLNKPNTEDKDIYNSVNIFKKSNKKNLYSDFNFGTTIIDKETLMVLQQVEPNIKEKTGDGRINVGIFDACGDEFIVGGYYEIKNSQNETVATFTGKSEIQTIELLTPDNYTLKEIIAPDRCYNDKNPYQFTIDNKKDNKEEYKYNVLYIYKERQNSEN